MYTAINAGIKALNNEWCTYINSDDILYEKSLMRAYYKLSDEADVIYGNIDTIDTEGRYLCHRRSIPTFVLGRFFSSGVMPFGQPGTLFRRSVWSKLGGFDEKYLYASDFDFFLRAYYAGFRFKCYTTSTVAGFRKHEKQLSRMALDRMREEISEVLKTVSCKPNTLSKAMAKYLFRILNIDNLACGKMRNIMLR